MDIAEKKEVKVDQIDKVEIKDADNLTGKYISKSRKIVSKTFAKRAIQWLKVKSVFLISILLFRKVLLLLKYWFWRENKINNKQK